MHLNLNSSSGNTCHSDRCHRTRWRITQREYAHASGTCSHSSWRAWGGLGADSELVLGGHPHSADECVNLLGAVPLISDQW